MGLAKQVSTFFDGTDERTMLRREHHKIRRLVENTDADGSSMCYYSHNGSDGWTWSRRDYLKLRLWLNSLGLLSLEDENGEGVYILWSRDEAMGRLIQQQNHVLKRLYERRDERWRRE